MEDLRKIRVLVVKNLKSRDVVEDPIKAEGIIFRHAKELCEPENLKETYKKLAFERLGELETIPREKRIDYLSSPGILWDAPAFKEHRDKKNKRLEFQVLQTTGGIKSGGIKCKKCGSKRVTFFLLQTRSADEGMKTFYTCHGCSHKWNEG